MKKILLFVAMLSFAVACGGNHQDGNQDKGVKADIPPIDELTVNKAAAFKTTKLEVKSAKQSELKIDGQLRVQGVEPKDDAK